MNIHGLIATNLRWNVMKHFLTPSSLADAKTPPLNILHLPSTPAPPTSNSPLPTNTPALEMVGIPVYSWGTHREVMAQRKNVHVFTHTHTEYITFFDEHTYSEEIIDIFHLLNKIKF